MWTALTTTFLFTLSFGIPFEVAEIITRDTSPNTAAWQPPLGAKFQITLSKGVSEGGFRSRNIVPGSADVLDLDLFDTSKATIQQLHAQEKRVICYFSAGSSESWRTDFKQLQAKDMGDPLRDWPREKWLDIRSVGVFKIMQTRIKMARDKGCDGIDPDNVDAYVDEGRRGGGFPVPLTSKDTVEYVRRLSTEAHQYGLAMGLKNAESILPQVSHLVEFAVNEQCATYSGCTKYQTFLNSGKPVFHIEYATYTVENGTSISLKTEDGHDQLKRMTSEQLHQLYCLRSSTGTRNRNFMSAETSEKFSTVIKNMDLNNWVMYCDGTWEGELKAAKTQPKSPKTTGKGAKSAPNAAKANGFGPATQWSGQKPEEIGAATQWSGQNTAENEAKPAANAPTPDNSGAATQWSEHNSEGTAAGTQSSGQNPGGKGAKTGGKGSKIGKWFGSWKRPY